LVSLVACAGVANAAIMTVDFSTDDGGSPLVNGQDISSPDEFGAFFNISSGGGNLGAAIFDSSTTGPNVAGPDPDLLVDLGNILILQSSTSPTQTVPGIFDTPNDSSASGQITFDFLSAVELLSVELVDIDGGNGMTITLLDGGGLSRVYSVPASWTNDVTSSPTGHQVLDLSTLLSQLGEGGATATAAEDAGFDPFGVVELEFRFDEIGRAHV